MSANIINNAICVIRCLGMSIICFRNSKILKYIDTKPDNIQEIRVSVM